MSKNLDELKRNYMMSERAENLGWCGLVGASILLFVASWGFLAGDYLRGKFRKNYLDHLDNLIEEDNKPEENEQ